MKKFFDPIMITGLLGLAFIFNSCQKEHEELPKSDGEQTILASSSTASLIERATSKDGSFDDVIDGASCFAVQFPYVVNTNGVDITIDSIDDIRLVRELMAGKQLGDDVLEIIFPVTIAYSDFEEVTINGKSDFLRLAAECNGNDADVIKCVDFVYPMALYTFDINKLQTGAITVESDKELRRFFANLSGNDLTSIDFPISLKLGDGTKIQVVNNTELANALENAKEDCDEAVQNNDDCKNCSVEQLTAFLSSCTSWFVPEFKLDNEPDLAQEFSGFEFSFGQDGAITVSKNGTSSAGTWTASGSGNNINVVIAIPDYPNFNATWKLHSLENYDDWKKTRLRFGDHNELVFKSNCGTNGETTVHPDNLRAMLKQCQWGITKAKNQNEGIDRLLGAKFSFGADGSVILGTGETSSEGTWEVATNKLGHTVLVLSIGNEPGISLEWPITELGSDKLEFKTQSGHELSLEKDCNAIDGGIMCTMEARAGLNVYVRLAGTQSISSEGITVTAVDGDYSEVLIGVNPDMADYAGAFERKGDYTVTVTKEGYQTFTSGVITVTADQCHVIGRVVQVMLVAEQ